MPKYEYRCNACRSHTEAEQRMSDPALVRCPDCGADALERLISNTSFALKGSGWYSDGYGAKKAESKPEGGEKKANAAEKPAEKTEKPAEKVEKPAKSED